MAGSVDSPRFSRDGGKGTLTDAPLEGVEGLISASTNRLLAGLSPSDFDILARHLKPVDLPLQKRLEVRRRAIEHVYFPESGFLSVVSDGENGDLLEIGMVGFEGMSGVPLLLGTDRSPNDTMVQNEGKGVRISATELSKAMRQSETLRNRLLLYAHAFCTQIAQTARANARNKIEERLARWLVMAHDRLRTDDLTITHEFLAVMLGVRRAGVGSALNILEEGALIATHRGVISVTNRGGLERASRGSYGASEKEFNRVLGK